ncbi:MAG: nuclear transport factor 2 family protein [Candidatus Binatia bacterium]|nr:nuclear transport factor 2 family protein [Candidatus Binatia bacterium]
MSDENLRDRLAIQDLLVRYGTSLDAKNWERLATCFLPDAVADYGTLGDHKGYDKIEKICRNALEPLDGSQHFISNFEITVDGDVAKSCCYLMAQHIRKSAPGGPHFILAGVYRDDLVRTSDGWRISRRELATTWTEGNPLVIG